MKGHKIMEYKNNPITHALSYIDLNGDFGFIPDLTEKHAKWLSRYLVVSKKVKSATAYRAINA